MARSRVQRKAADDRGRKKARYSPEQQQEDRSLGQVKDRLAEHGWPSSKLERDVGEDLAVQIHDTDGWSGLTFLVQCKSAVDATKRQGQRAPAFSLGLDVADLRHWEDAASLVVLFLWDVTKKTGWWMTVPDAIAELERRCPNWRTHGTATVHIPLKNTTDAAGLSALRQAVAEFHRPLFSRGRKMTLRPVFKFPRTRQGLKKHRELLDAIELGETARIDGRYVSGLNMPAWWERPFGKGTIEYLQISSTPSSAEFAMRVEFEVDGQISASVDVGVRRTKAGTRKVTLSNEHEDSAVTVVLVGDQAPRQGQGDLEMTLHAVQCHQSPYTTRDAIRVLQAMKRGGRVRLIGRRTGVVLVEGAVQKGTCTIPSQELLAWQHLAEKLCVLQSRVARFGSILIQEPVTEETARNVEQLHQACTTGWSQAFVEFKFVTTPQEVSTDVWEGANIVDTDGPPAAVAIPMPDTHELQVFNVAVPLGRVTMHFHEAIRFRDAVLMAKATERTEEVTLSKMRVSLEYLDWGPDKNGPAKRVYDQAIDATSALGLSEEARGERHSRPSE